MRAQQPKSSNFHRGTSMVMMAGFLLGAAGTGCSARVWIDETKTVSVAADRINSLNVETHNGDIQITGKSDATRIEATIHARYGGWNQKSAEECKAAVEIVSTTDANGCHSLKARFNRPKANDWQAMMSYSITVPERLAASLTSFNGDVIVTDIQGTCEVTTHNGDVAVDAESARVAIETYNGDARVESPAESLEVVSHNGDIQIDASRAKHLGGKLNTYNGRITAKFGEFTSSELACETYNGKIRAAIPWRMVEMDRRRATGKLGDGDSRFELESHNGDISLTQ